MCEKIKKPEGMDLINHINAGDAICNKCGAIMDHKPDPMGGCDIYICPSCKWEIDEMDYEYIGFKLDEKTSITLAAYGDDIPPAGCIACGGPYPDCKTSCKLFDD